MNHIVHFELPVSDPETAMKFYSTVFGWTFHKWDGPMDYWTITTGSGETGIDGGLMRHQHPDQPVACTASVENVDAICAAIVAAGGEIAVPKMAVPGIGWLAYFKDPDGLISGVMQDDPTAAL